MLDVGATMLAIDGGVVCESPRQQTGPCMVESVNSMHNTIHSPATPRRGVPGFKAGPMKRVESFDVIEEGGVVVEAQLVTAPAPEPPAEPPKDTLAAMVSYQTPTQTEVMQEDGEHRMAF